MRFRFTRRADTSRECAFAAQCKSLTEIRAAHPEYLAINAQSAQVTLKRLALAFDAFFRRAGIVIEPVTEEQAHAARQAYADFGKGRHPAGLNFGDCFAYALAKLTREPLLFKGRDFSKTDIKSAL